VIGHVGVAVEDDGEFGGGGIEVEGFEVVEHIEVEAGVGRVLDENDFGFGKFGAGAFAVDVAADGGDGGDFGELVEDGDFSHVTDVQNAVDAAESGSDFRTEETVSVRDDAEEHGERISGASGVISRVPEGERPGAPGASRLWAPETMPGEPNQGSIFRFSEQVRTWNEVLS
jgi:hypothetical protein